jgi:hypothetical protein
MCLLIAAVLVSAGCDGVSLKRDYYHYDGSDNSYGDGRSDNAVPRLSDDPYAISNVFNVPLTYEEAYRRASAYATACRTSKTFSFSRPSWMVRSELFDDDRQGFVHITSKPFGPDLERIDINAIDASASSIRVSVRNSPTWDQLEMDAARQSIETGRFVCRDTTR